MKKDLQVCITGGTGLVGSALATRFVRPTILSRSQRANAPDDTGPRFVRWQPDEGPPPAEALTDHDVVFHLAGEPVAKGRWTDTKKQRIRDSRVMATRHLVEGIAAADRKPQVLVAASAVGYYGSSGDTLLSENAPPGSGFLAEVCIDWEAEAMKAAQHGVRVVCVRIGIVLSRQGGAIEQMLLPFKMGLGGRLGDGQQWMSWIHINDMIGLLCHAADSDISGPMNGVAPQAVRNAEFTRALGKALGRPTFLPVPKFALKAGFGEMSKVLLQSQRVSPDVALRSGYTFQFTDVEQAMRDVVLST